MLSPKEPGVDIRRQFSSIFGVPLHRFHNRVFGFDIVRFDDWLGGTVDGQSLRDLVKERYGSEGVEIIECLIDYKEVKP